MAQRILRSFTEVKVQSMHRAPQVCVGLRVHYFTGFSSQRQVCVSENEMALEANVDLIPHIHGLLYYLFLQTLYKINKVKC